MPARNSPKRRNSKRQWLLEDMKALARDMRLRNGDIADIAEVLIFLLEGK